MKVVSTEALTKLIQLVKSAFIKVDDVAEVTEIETEIPSEITLATVATTGDYEDLINKPTIPTVNNATLTIQKNGTNVAAFTANASSNVTANISVPTTTSSVTSGSTAALTSGGAYTNLVRRKSTSSATGSTSQGVYVDANGQVQPCDAVTSTYAATGTAPVNGTAVSNAIATKQDNLVSGTNIKTINGNSLLGSGNITIETSSTPNVDGTTISYNSSDALQAIAVKNVRDNSTLPIWHGTEYQWNHGDPTTWYYWQTSVTALWTSGGNISAEVKDIVYGNNMFVALSSSGGNIIGTNDNGETWTQLTSPPEIPAGAYDEWNSITYGDGKFVVISNLGKYIAYSDDNCQTWVSSSGIDASQYGYNLRIYYINNKFIINTGDDSFGCYTSYTEDLINWSSFKFHRGLKITYGNDRYVSTVKGRYWSQSQDLENWSNYNLEGYRYISSEVAYGNGKFIALTDIDDQRNRISILNDNSDVWDYQSKNIPIQGHYIAYGNGTFMIINVDGLCCYSTDGGDNWSQTQIPLNNTSMLIYGNDTFLCIKNTSQGQSAIFTIQYDKCYTDTANPTTTSVVYSAPNTTSALTISSVTSGAITLSNNNTYYYNQSGNQYTYDTIGNSHPEYLCFIDGVGVKIGNTTIATNNSNS